MKPELYRQQDYREAVREHACAEDCLKEIGEALRTGDLMNAMQRLFDLETTVMELKRLAGKKQEENRYLKLVQDLADGGVRIDLVVKKIV